MSFREAGIPNITRKCLECHLPKNVTHTLPGQSDFRCPGLTALAYFAVMVTTTLTALLSLKLFVAFKVIVCLPGFKLST